MNINEFTIKINDLECRSCQKHLLSPKPHTTAVIVKWEDGTCRTLAYWKQDSEGFYLCFITDRPFTECSQDSFWDIARTGQFLLDSSFFKEETI